MTLKPKAISIKLSTKKPTLKLKTPIKEEPLNEQDIFNDEPPPYAPPPYAPPPYATQDAFMPPANPLDEPSVLSYEPEEDLSYRSAQ